MIEELSILLPSYNNRCVELVEALQRQASLVPSLRYEILVADDGSTCQETVEQNRAIDRLPHCRLLLRGENTGRARIRNFLVRQSRYRYLLFIDSDQQVVRDDYLLRYLRCGEAAVVYGGTTILPHAANANRSNLRWLYEKAASKHNQAEQRNKHPYFELSTCNMLVQRQWIERCPLDERFSRYGYEDVLFGKRLCENGAQVLHIDNPIGFNNFEPNADFVRKTDDALRTLCDFRTDLQGFSSLLSMCQRFRRLCLPIWLIRLWHKLFKARERANLQGRSPSLLLFKLYKLGTFDEMWRRDVFPDGMK